MWTEGQPSAGERAEHLLSTRSLGLQFNLLFASEQIEIEAKWKQKDSSLWGRGG